MDIINMSTYLIGLVMMCSCSSSIASGYFLYQQELERQRIANIEQKAEDGTEVMIFTECDYKGTEYLFNDEQAFLTMNVKSLVVPNGYKVDTYSKPDKGGVKISYGGPTKMRCIDVPYLEMTKV